MVLSIFRPELCKLLPPVPGVHRHAGMQTRRREKANSRHHVALWWLEVCPSCPCWFWSQLPGCEGLSVYHHYQCPGLDCFKNRFTILVMVGVGGNGGMAWLKLYYFGNGKLLISDILCTTFLPPLHLRSLLIKVFIDHRRMIRGGLNENVSNLYLLETFWWGGGSKKWSMTARDRKYSCTLFIILTVVREACDRCSLKFDWLIFFFIWGGLYFIVAELPYHSCGGCVVTHLPEDTIYCSSHGWNSHQCGWTGWTCPGWSTLRQKYRWSRWREHFFKFTLFKSLPSSKSIFQMTEMSLLQDTIF